MRTWGILWIAGMMNCVGLAWAGPGSPPKPTPDQVCKDTAEIQAAIGRVYLKEKAISERDPYAYLKTDWGKLVKNEDHKYDRVIEGVGESQVIERAALDDIRKAMFEGLGGPLEEKHLLSKDSKMLLEYVRKAVANPTAVELGYRSLLPEVEKSISKTALGTTGRLVAAAGSIAMILADVTWASELGDGTLTSYYSKNPGKALAQLPPEATCSLVKSYPEALRNLGGVTPRILATILKIETDLDRLKATYDAREKFFAQVSDAIFGAPSLLTEKLAQAAAFQKKTLKEKNLLLQETISQKVKAAF